MVEIIGTYTPAPPPASAARAGIYIWVDAWAALVADQAAKTLFFFHRVPKAVHIGIVNPHPDQ